MAGSDVEYHPSLLGRVSALTERAFSSFGINSHIQHPIQLQRHRQQSVNFFDDALSSVNLNSIPVPDTHDRRIHPAIRIHSVPPVRIAGPDKDPQGRGPGAIQLNFHARPVVRHHTRIDRAARIDLNRNRDDQPGLAPVRGAVYGEGRIEHR